MWKQRQLPGEVVECLARGGQQRLTGDGRLVALFFVLPPFGRIEVAPSLGSSSVPGIPRRCRRFERVVLEVEQCELLDGCGRAQQSLDNVKRTAIRRA
jgi:hypothetical protein